MIVDTLFPLGIVVCDGFVVSSFGSWNSFSRVLICFCIALLFQVLSSMFFLFDVFYGLYSAGVSVLSDVVLFFVDTPMVLYADLYHEMQCKVAMVCSIVAAWQLKDGMVLVWVLPH